MRLLLITVAFACLLPTLAFAQDVSDDERAATHFRVAEQFFADENFESALTEFETAYALSPRPELLYNIGLCHDRLGQWSQARDTYQRFVDLAPADQHAEAATARLARARERAAAAEEESAETGSDAPSGQGSAIAGWGLLGLGAASGVVALATGLAAHGIHGDLEDSCGEARVCAADQQADIDKGQRLARTSTTMMFIGIAGAAAGVLVLVLGGGGDEDSVAASVAPVPGGAYASAALRF